MQRSTLAKVVAVSTAAIVSIGVYAATVASAPNDARAMPTTQFSLAQAVNAAEQQTGGKASKAEVERNAKGEWVYDVEVVTPTQVLDVQVDAISGAVLSATEDKVDQDREDDDDHDGEHDKKD